MLKRAIGEIARCILDWSPISVGAGGRKRRYLINSIQPFFKSGGVRWRRFLDLELQCDLSCEVEASFYILARAIQRFYRDQPLTRVLRSAYSPRKVFVDVGANLGAYSLFARHIGYSSVLFEPEPRHAKFLKRNASVFGHVSDCALSDNNGSVRFNVASECNPGASSLVGEVSEPSKIGYAGQVDVLCSRFDDIIHGFVGDRADICLVKIDVEGHEVSVLKGMGRLFAEGYRPDLWCEVNGPSSPRAANSFQGVVSYLKAFEYEAFVYGDSERVPFKEDMLESLGDSFDIHFCVSETFERSKTHSQ